MSFAAWEREPPLRPALHSYSLEYKTAAEKLRQLFLRCGSLQISNYSAHTYMCGCNISECSAQNRVRILRQGPRLLAFRAMTDPPGSFSF